MTFVGEDIGLHALGLGLVFGLVGLVLVCVYMCYD